MAHLRCFEKIGSVAYRLQLPPSSSIHPMFHVSLLKRCVSPSVQSQPLPDCLSNEWELQVQPTEVLATRMNAVGAEEVLVKWVCLPDFENSWELKSIIQQDFPNFHLERKADLQEEGIIRDPSFRINYARKKRGNDGPSSGPWRGKRQNNRLFDEQKRE